MAQIGTADEAELAGIMVDAVRRLGELGRDARLAIIDALDAVHDDVHVEEGMGQLEDVLVEFNH